MYYLATPQNKEKFTDSNIFQDPITQILKNKGPQTDRDLVGPAKQFQKLSEINSQSFEQSQIQQVELTKFQKFYQSIKPQIGQMKMKMINQQEVIRAVAEPKIKKKQHLPQPELFSKNEIIYQLKQLRQQNKIRQEQKDDLIDNLRQEAKRLVTKEQRILSQFQNLQSNRRETTEILANRTGRSVDRTLYQRSNEHRRRKEFVDALDGNLLLDKRIWYRQIRKSNHDDHPPLNLYSIDEKQSVKPDFTKVISDIYTNFSTHSTPKKQFTEIIQFNVEGDCPLYTKKTKEELKKRLQKISPDSPLLSFDFKQELKLEGVNKLNRELESVQQDCDDSLYQIAPINEQKTNEEDVIINNWNLGKKGETYYPKLTKYIM